MNKELTEIVVILDKSGSMGVIREDTIGGFNSFLAEQKAAEDTKARLTLVTFNSRVDIDIDSRDVAEVEPLDLTTYRPGGGTSLLDAIGQTIDLLEDKYTNEEDANKIPAKVIFTIITDGQENTSKTYSKERIAKMIKHQTKRHGWEFAFLGANLDAVKEAQGIGIAESNALNFHAGSVGVADTFRVMSKSTLSYRNTGDAMYAENIAGTSLESINTNITINAGTINADEIAKSVKDALKNSSGSKI